MIASRNGANNIIVNSPDTDVWFCYCITDQIFVQAFSKVFFLTGRTGTHIYLKRFIPVHELFHKITGEQQNIFMLVYFLTGCDTCNAFFGIEKKSAYKIRMQNAKNFQLLAQLGIRPPTKAQRFACTKFVGLFYGKNNCNSLNEIRCEKALKKVPPKSYHQPITALHSMLCVVVTS